MAANRIVRMGPKRVVIDTYCRCPGVRSLYRVLPQRARRFHAYAVGLPRSGTHSIGGLFSRFAAQHEPLASVTLENILQWQGGQRSRSHQRAFLGLRDRWLGLELEASHFLVYCLPAIQELFPEARFIFTVRDPYSWLISEMSTNQESGGHATWRHYEEFRYLHTLPWERQPNSSALFPLRSYLEYWRFHCEHVTQTVPGDRLLIVPTVRISDSIHDLSAFLDIDPAELTPSKSHLSRKAQNRKVTLTAAEQGDARALIEEICIPFIKTSLPQLADVLAP